MVSSSKRILIAEDDKGIIEVMRIILEAEGYAVYTASSYKEVKQQLTKHEPQLLFLDIRLGGDSGEEIARTLRGEAKTRALPIVMVSADNETEEIAEQVGANGFLLKPFDMEALVATVKKYCK